VLKSKPVAYWGFDEFSGPRAADASGHGCHGVYEDGIAFYLDGVDRAGMAAPGRTSRAAHFAGGRMKAAVPCLAKTYSVEFWFWNGLAGNVRPFTGILFSRGKDGDNAAPGDHLGIGGTATSPDRPICFPGGECSQMYQGKTPIPLRSWNHVVLVKDGKRVAVYLNFGKEPEIAVKSIPGCEAGVKQVFLGGDSGGDFARSEGKIDEAAIYDRALGPDEIAEHAAALGPKNHGSARNVRSVLGNH